MTTTTTRTWTKELVQEHAKTAVKVEIYTLPFYLTALASIAEPEHSAYSNLLSICIEEMLHLQLAANLCIALDTKPEFPAPEYGKSIPYLNPNNPDTGHHKLINAKFDALNETTLNLMLDIETPSGLEPHRHPDKGIWKIIHRDEDALEKVWNIEHHRTPQYPYDTIGEMYDALIAGIHHVGSNNFSWGSKNQQALWPKDDEKFPQTITSFDDAIEAVKTISLQGEGKTIEESKYSIPLKYRLENERDEKDSKGLDINEYSHYEKLLNIKSQDLPEVFTTTNEQGKPEQQQALTKLQSDFDGLLKALDGMWNNGDTVERFWQFMPSLLTDAQTCWGQGVIPKWS